MRIYLAPMEGVVDPAMRGLLTEIGGYDRCVTEFIRVNQQLLPERVFLRYAPELEQGSKTSAGVPVYIQLLGGDAHFMALNAARLVKLQPAGLDLNFGCPSKTVTKSDGGSALLKEPERIGAIIAAVRDAVDPSIPVTAKIRLGFSNHDYLEDLVEKIQLAGADEICIHARTREDRYKPPAYWSVVSKVAKKSKIPIIINGEIWNSSDALTACQQSDCRDIMLGRGALSQPDLAATIKARSVGQDYKLMSWQEVRDMLLGYLIGSQNKHPRFVCNRSKQWLVFMQRQYPEAHVLFEQLKRLRDTDQVLEKIKKS